MEVTSLSASECSNADYHSRPAVSNSRLKDFIEDPRVYWWKYISGKYVPERRDVFDFGSAVHEVVLLKDHANIAVIPSSVLSKSGARSGSAWKEWSYENRHKLQLKQADYDSVRRCADAVFDNPAASKLLGLSGESEKSFFCADDTLEMDLKCRADRLTDSGIVIDLKTAARSTIASRFVREVTDFGYHYQDYFYRRVLSAVGIEVKEFVFIAVSKENPHTVDCFTLDEQFREHAQNTVENALGRLADCVRCDSWFAGSDDIKKLSPPNYLRYRGDYQE